MTLASWWRRNMSMVDPPLSRSFGESQPTQQREVARSAPDIAVKNVREDRPKFGRAYSARLDERAVCTVVAKNFCGRSFYGELRQPNGNSMWFDPDRVADRVLDPTLVPLVERFLKEVKRLDQEFMDSRPSLFVDEVGTTWVRQKRDSSSRLAAPDSKETATK
jgi:hypothetical protein